MYRYLVLRTRYHGVPPKTNGEWAWMFQPEPQALQWL